MTATVTTSTDAPTATAALTHPNWCTQSTQCSPEVTMPQHVGLVTEWAAQSDNVTIGVSLVRYDEIAAGQQERSTIRTHLTLRNTAFTQFADIDLDLDELDLLVAMLTENGGR